MSTSATASSGNDAKGGGAIFKPSITSNQTKNNQQEAKQNVFKFDIDQVPSIADITHTESIAEMIEIVDDDNENNQFYKDSSTEAQKKKDEDSDKTIENDLEDMLKVPKNTAASNEARRESQETVIFAPKKIIDEKIEKTEVELGNQQGLRKTLSFQQSLQSDILLHDNNQRSHEHKKKKKKKHKRKLQSDTSTEASAESTTYSSKSDKTRSSEKDDTPNLKREHHRSKHRKKRSRSKGCWYCKNACDYHREKNLNTLDRNEPHKSSSKLIDEGTQAGPSYIPSMREGMNNRHYLFDPCADAFFDYPRGAVSKDGMDSLRYDSKTEAAKIAKLYLTTNPCQIPSSSKDKTQSIVKGLNQVSGNNPMAFALSELLRGQLDLTANFLSSQKKLYATYCSNLDSISMHKPNENIFDDVLHDKNITEKKLRRSKRIDKDGEGKRLKVPNKDADDNFSVSEELILEEYESEFEEELSDTELVEMNTDLGKMQR